MKQYNTDRVLISSDTSSTTLQKLANSGNEQTRYQVAQHPNTPPDVLKQLFRRYPIEVLTNPIMELLLLENPNFLEELCDYLSLEDFIFDLIPHKLPLFFLEWGLNNPRSDIRLKFDCLIHIPVEFLNTLYRNGHDSIIRQLAKNKNTPVKILEQLSLDQDYSIRADVARNENTPVKILEQLSLDRDLTVRCCVASNQNTPWNILEKLSLDQDRAVRADVARQMLRELTNSDDKQTRCQVAQNPNTPPDVLKILFRR
ncbi:MAG: hypothetical protein QNJ65_20795 [Xenococcaceae cyanobacterium MO_234.B1]|nr:hypothetical protein [Xenococcaceae cyanobacterium MO_234.B1]